MFLQYLHQPLPSPSLGRVGVGSPPHLFLPPPLGGLGWVPLLIPSFPLPLGGLGWVPLLIPSYPLPLGGLGWVPLLISSFPLPWEGRGGFYPPSFQILPAKLLLFRELFKFYHNKVMKIPFLQYLCKNITIRTYDQYTSTFS